MRYTLAFAITCAMAVAQVSATTIVDEDFESYADTAALGGTWSLGDGTLDGALGNPGNSLFHPGTSGSFSGGNTNSLSFADVYPAPGETLVFEADIYDDGTSANKRTTAGIRGTGSANILEMGMYNNPNHYAIRTILFASGATNYAEFTNMVDDAGDPLANAPVAGWHTFRAEITQNDVVVTVDLNGDGNINGTLTVPAVANVAGWNIVRLGGPSDVSSAGGGANFDNVSLTLNAIPEPSSAILLAGMFGLGLVQRRK